jgi:hypothetical protein
MWPGILEFDLVFSDKHVHIIYLKVMVAKAE